VAGYAHLFMWSLFASYVVPLLSMGWIIAHLRQPISIRAVTMGAPEDEKNLFAQPFCPAP